MYVQMTSFTRLYGRPFAKMGQYLATKGYPGREQQEANISVMDKWWPFRSLKI